MAAIWGQLGAIAFSILESPTSWSGARESAIAEHAVATGKPRLQRMGDGLETFTLVVHLHPMLGAVGQRLADLAAAQSDNAPLPFVLGSGRVMGRYVITKLEYEILVTNADGEPFEARVTISVKEWNAAASTPRAATAAKTPAQSAKPTGGRIPPAVDRDHAAPVTHVVDGAVGVPGGHPFMPALTVTRWPVR